MADHKDSWTDASRELDDIVASFDDGDVSVDELIVKLERASAIIAILEERLTETKAKVEELVPTLTRTTDPDA